MASSRKYSTPTQCGNIIVILAFALTGLFAVASFAIDSAVYLLKRQQLQSLAASVALASASSLPNREAAEQSAAEWYEALRYNGTHTIAPSVEESHDAFSVIVNDNASLTSETQPYKATSVTIRIRDQYTPKIFPSLSNGITVIGEATAQLVPTDVILVVENTASLIADNAPLVSQFAQTFGSTLAKHYAKQCFGSPLTEFKSGVINLYDHLSAIGTFRVGVVLSSSKDSVPFVFSQLGQEQLTSQNLPYDQDEPYAPSTRCAAMTSTSSFAIPPPTTTGLLLLDNYWKPRQKLSSLLQNPSQGHYALRSTAKLLIREALWIQSFGQTTSSGFIHPRYFYSDTLSAIRIAQNMLSNSRRQDSLSVSRRVVLVLTDDAGILPGQKRSKSLCAMFRDHLQDNRTILGILYYGHNKQLLAHDYRKLSSSGQWVEKLRKDCTLPDQHPLSTFFIEASPANGLKHSDYAETVMSTVAQALKQTELRR